jgi:hypothetical protein
MNLVDAPRDYVVPCYRAEGDAPWFHFLHGNVPGHQIDFMYRPEVPQGALSRQHYSHLSRLMKYIEPPGAGEYAFAIGNLSRDDTQHEPGHGGVALIFGLRIRGATDHAGRPDPPFAHGVAAIDRALDAAAILAAARAFHRHVLGEAASAEWYRSYVRSAIDDPGAIPRVLADYVAAFDDLPHMGPSDLSLTWTTGGAPGPSRIVLVYPDDAPFEALAHAASRLAAVLYRSDVRWSAISSGREADLPNGLTVRFVAESAVSPNEPQETMRSIADVPDDAESIARELFHAAPVSHAKPSPARGWRERYAAERPSRDTEEISVDLPRPSWEGQRPSAPERTSRPTPETPIVDDEPTTHFRVSPREDDAVMRSRGLVRDTARPPDRASAEAGIDVEIDAPFTDGADVDDSAATLNSSLAATDAPSSERPDRPAFFEVRLSPEPPPPPVAPAPAAPLPLPPPRAVFEPARPSANVSIEEADELRRLRSWKPAVVGILCAMGLLTAVYLLLGGTPDAGSSPPSPTTAATPVPPSPSPSPRPVPNPQSTGEAAPGATPGRSAAPSPASAGGRKGPSPSKLPGKGAEKKNPTPPPTTSTSVIGTPPVF